jgi:hypothetical protein
VEAEGGAEGGRGTKGEEGTDVEEKTGGRTEEERGGERGGVQTPGVVANKRI